MHAVYDTSRSADASISEAEPNTNAAPAIQVRLPYRFALDMLTHAPPIDKLVVCHGDACAPNTLLGDDGCWSGHVDLGALGVADRWADLAIATWSTEWNYGPGWEDHLLVGP
jgi:aminoglycoside phosphotransferase